MKQFRSVFFVLIERFIEYRKASGSWNEGYGQNIKLFDHFCADHYQSDTTLTQAAVDAWCAKRSTETNGSHMKRIQVVRLFVDYLQCRELTNVIHPEMSKPEPSTYIPHAFEGDELSRFFQACDSIQPHLGRREAVIRKFTVPVFFRLLYSTGMRTTEARLLKKDNVDLGHGIIDIQKSKGYDQHYVAMHDTLTSLMERYDKAVAQLQPSREYFFQSDKGSHYSRHWVSRNFRTLWGKANGTIASPVAYDLRHHYSVMNINSWADDGFGFSDKLQYLSKSMGHRSIEATRYYYSIVPRLAETLRDRTEKGFNAIVPEVVDDEDE